MLKLLFLVLALPNEKVRNPKKILVAYLFNWIATLTHSEENAELAPYIILCS